MKADALVLFIWLAGFSWSALGALEVEFLFNEGDTANFTDTSGNDVVGTIENYASSVWTNDSISGLALQFPGEDLCGKFPNVLATFNNWTITFWMKTIAVAPQGNNQWWSGAGLVDAEVNGNTNDFGVAMVTSRVAFGTGAPDVSVSSPLGMNNGEWHFVSAVRYVLPSEGASVLELFIDAQLRSTITNYENFSPLDAPPAIAIGCIQTNSWYFNGTMDNVRIYSHRLLAGEIFTEMVTDVPELLTTEATSSAEITTSEGSSIPRTTTSENASSDVVEESEGDSPVLIIIVSAVAAVLLCAVCIVLFVVMRRRKQIGGPKKPMWRPIAFGSFLSPIYRSEYDAPLKELEQVIVSKDMHFTQVIKQSVPTMDVESIAKSMIFISESHGQSIEFLKWLIDLELKSADNVSTLFRSNTMVSASITAYFKMVGWEYLWETLSRIIFELDQSMREEKEITQSSYSADQSLTHISVEVDPMKLNDTDDADLNALYLQFVAQKLMKSITNSDAKIPIQIRIVLSYLRKQVSAKFEDDKAKYISIGSFLFLRFICPSLVSPHVYGLTENPPTEKLQRTLILLSKVMQNIANNTRAGQKEPFMEKLNEFVNSNVDKVQSFYERIVTSSFDTWTPTIEIPETVKVNSLVTMHNSIVNNKDSFEKHTEALELKGSAFDNQLHEALNHLGPLRPKK